MRSWKYQTPKNHYKELVKQVKPGEIMVIPMDNRLLENPPYVNSVSRLPTWFRKLPKFKGSMRGCAGIMDYMSLGITIPMWTNASFKKVENGWEVDCDRYEPENNKQVFGITSFPYESSGACPMTERREQGDFMGYPKFTTPYHVITAPGYSTLLLGIAHEPNKNYHVVNGLVHTDFYHEMNMVVNVFGNQSFNIKYGTPMMQLIPFKRDSDFGNIIFTDESMTKYVKHRGMTAGAFAPHDMQTAKHYRLFTAEYENKLKKK